MGTMLIPDQTGHSTISWSQGSVHEEAAAAEIFRELRSRRMQPFRRDCSGEYSQLKDFDPGADEILWVRPLQGG